MLHIFNRQLSRIATTGILFCASVTAFAATTDHQERHFTVKDHPVVVLQNIVNAFQDGDAVNYNKSFSETSFSFEPATSARTKYGGELMSWDKTKEQRYFEKVINHFSNNSKVVLVFDPFTPTSLNSMTSQVETAYHITLPPDAGVIKKFNGKVQYTLSQDQSGFWYINQWVDVGTNTSDSTWSDLKGFAFSEW